MEREFNLISLLDYIDPGSLDYTEWVQVGMALKHEGYSAQDWDDWSQKDASRYHQGECEKKWESFEENGSIVTGSTITQLAKENGWKSAREDEQILGWEESFVATDSHFNTNIDKNYKLIDTDYLDGQEIKEPKSWNPAKEITTYLETLFDPGDTIGFVTQAREHENNDGTVKYVPDGVGVYSFTAGYIIDQIRRSKGDIGAVMGDPNPEAGAWIRFNPLDGQGVKNDDVTDFKYALVESDSQALEIQNKIYQELELPIATLTYTGGKSLHAIVKIDAKNYPQYKERVEYLYDILKKNGLRIDKQNKNPARLSRLPGFQRGNKKQFLVATNIGQEDWDSWKEYIEDLNDNLPEIENLDGLLEQEIILAPELIHGVLRQGHKLLIAGPSKAGKSFTLIEMTAAIGAGAKWFGFDVERGPVLYVNLELDGRSAKKRFVDIYNALGYDPKYLKNIDIWNLRGKTSPMDKLAPKLIRRAKDKNYMAVVIDPIYKVLTGDENSASDMANFVNLFDMIATELGCAVIYAHHHSKGSQGAKSSIDRSSGSGVFARDPDAILDLIELPIDEARRSQLENSEVCDVFYQTIAKYRPEYLPEISLDDRQSRKQMGHYLMVAINGVVDNSQAILKENAEKVTQVIKQVSNRTAWRLEGTLREFPKFDPVNVWFKYPLHVVDSTLADVELDIGGAGNKNWKKTMQKANTSKSEKKQKELEEAFNIMSEDGGPIEVSKVAGYLEIQSPAVYKRVNKSDKFEVIDGMVRKKKETKGK